MFTPIPHHCVVHHANVWYLYVNVAHNALHMWEKIWRKKGDIHEFENLQNTTMKTSEPSTPTAPKWILRTIDDEPYLIYTESEIFF